MASSSASILSQKEQRIREMRMELNQVQGQRSVPDFVDARVVANQNAGGGVSYLEQQLAGDAKAQWSNYVPDELPHEQNGALYFYEVHRRRKTEGEVYHRCNIQFGRKTLEEAMIGDLTKPMTVKVRFE
ncbi:unnamed protein product [Amoebophrya sp. A120]|nr:unnamed protein product [Amoebophrya sp. A120]|eukprot:GSA120T00021624001.1